MEIDRKAFRSISYGLYIITTRAGDKKNGQLANTVFQVTSDPPKIVVCLNKENYTCELLKDSNHFGVSVLSTDADHKFIGPWGFRSGRDFDKFEGIEFKEGETVPLVTQNSLSCFELKVTDTIDVGTHMMFIGEVTSAEVVGSGEALTYAIYHSRKGREPKTAPTYIPEEKEEKRSKNMKYVCNICGYVYDPAVGDPDNDVDPGTKFEDVSEDWVCPLCGAPKDDFSPQE